MKRTIVTTTVLALAMGGVGVAQAQKPSETGYKVTGGGQIIADPSGGGAGDTVGFNAHDLNASGPEARGQFQYVPRGQSSNASAPTEKFHGVVTCLISGGEAIANENAEEDGQFNEALQEGSARFGGYVRTKDGSTQYFTVDVTDNGQGGNAEDDMILVRFTSEACADNPEDEKNDPEQMLMLGRGNVKIHNNIDGDSTAASSAATAAALTALAR
ncbi:MAG: hypothetical protein ACLGIG_00620 [Actinomycetes bacterium]